MGDGPVIELTGVAKRYRRRGADVLSGVCLRLDPGSVVGVAGLSGSGKSTLLRMIAGVTAPSAGTISGRPAIRGYVPERFPPGLRFTPLQYLGHMGRIRGLPSAVIESGTRDLAARLGLEPFLTQRMADVSKGNCQKVALAQALLGTPPLLVLDEPWTGLDEGTQVELIAILAEVRSAGAVVVFSDQRESVLGTVADRILRIADGAVGEYVAPPPVEAEIPPAEAVPSPSAVMHGPSVRVELTWPDPGASSAILRSLGEVVPLGTWGGVAMGRGALSLEVSDLVVDALLRRALELGLSVQRVARGSGG